MSNAINHLRTFPKGTPAAGQKHRLTKAIATTVKAGAGHYERTRHLPGLIGVDPDALSGGGAISRKVVLEWLKRALRAERRRAKAGHWAYDLNRHIALRQALMAEDGYDPDHERTPDS